MGSTKWKRRRAIGLMIAATIFQMALAIAPDHSATHASPAQLESYESPQGQSPDTSQRAVNGKIAFASDVAGNYEIYLVDGDGKNRIQLTNNSAADLDPTWSPDGKKIAFTSNRDGNYEIYV